MICSPMKVGAGVLAHRDSVTNYLDNRKGVIVDIRPDHEMPEDEDGNIADMVLSTTAPIARLNIGQLYEHFINAASRDLTKWIREQLLQGNEQAALDKLLVYYKVTSPRMYEVISKYSKDKLLKHLYKVEQDGIYLVINPADEHLGLDLIRNVIAVAPPARKTIRFVDKTGRKRTMIRKGIIAPKAMIVLEKTNHRPSSAATGALQHHGLLAGTTKENRNAHPNKQVAMTMTGETEVRLISATIGGSVAAELMDLANNPETAELVTKNIIRAEDPSNITDVANRKLRPLGGNRATKLFMHYQRCRGTRMARDKWVKRNGVWEKM